MAEFERRRWHEASGRGSIRGIVSLLLVVTVAYGCFKIIPPRAAAFQLDDEVREQVILAGSRRRKISDDEIRRTLLRRAEELGLPIDGRDIVIRRRGGNVLVQVDYTVRVDFPLDYHYDWHFQASHEGPSF